jgi:hypothetical protein
MHKPARIALVIALLGLAAFPLTAEAAGVTLTNLTIANVNTNSDSILIDFGKTPAQMGQGCGSTSNFAVLRVGSTWPTWQQQFQVLLSSKLSASKMSVRFNGCYSVGGTTYPIVSEITLN